MDHRITPDRAHPAISHCSRVEWLQIYKSLAKGSQMTYFRKSVFLSAFGFSNIAFIIPHSLLVCHILLFECRIFFNTIRVSYSLDPDQARHFAGPDLGPNCSQRVSADESCQ